MEQTSKEDVTYYVIVTHYQELIANTKEILVLNAVCLFIYISKYIATVQLSSYRVDTNDCLKAKGN